MDPAQVCLTQRTGNYADAQETRTRRVLCSAVVGGNLCPRSASILGKASKQQVS